MSVWIKYLRIYVYMYRFVSNMENLQTMHIPLHISDVSLHIKYGLKVRPLPSALAVLGFGQLVLLELIVDPRIGRFLSRLQRFIAEISV